MALPYWLEADLRARVGIDALLSVLDRDNTGAVDADALARLQKDCDARIEVALGIGGYPIALIRVLKPEPVVTASLDAANVYVWKNAPDHIRGDWEALEDRLEKFLKKLEDGGPDLDLPDPVDGIDSGMAVVSDALRGW